MNVNAVLSVESSSNGFVMKVRFTSSQLPSSPSNIPVITTISNKTEQVRVPGPEPRPSKLIDIRSQEEEVPVIQANETSDNLGQP